MWYFKGTKSVFSSYFKYFVIPLENTSLGDIAKWKTGVRRKKINVKCLHINKIEGLLKKKKTDILNMYSGINI